MAGYKMEALRQERQRLELDRASLELEETKLLSPARLEELARMQRFVDPAPEAVVYLEATRAIKFWRRSSGTYRAAATVRERIEELSMDPLATKRVHVLVRVAFIWAALIVARLIQLQVIQHPKFAEMAREQQQKVEEVKAPRGAILDRYGQRLAMSLPAESVVRGSFAGARSIGSRRRSFQSSELGRIATCWRS